MEYPTYKKYEFRKRASDNCLIIPVINEGNRFKEQLLRVKKYLSYVDVIVADGGSNDGSTNLAYLKRQGVTALLVKTGSGKLGAQYRMAYEFALKKGYINFLHMDGNGKDDPKSIPAFIKVLGQGFDYVQGSRFVTGGKAVNTPLEREFAIKFIFSPLLSLSSGKRYTDASNGHRAYSKRLLTHPELLIMRNVFSGYEILFYVTARAHRLGLRSVEIPVTRSYPPAGKTPTKIVGISKKLDVLLMAVKAAVGYFNP